MNELFDRFIRVKSDRLVPSTLVQRYEDILRVYLRPAFGRRRRRSDWPWAARTTTRTSSSHDPTATRSRSGTSPRPSKISCGRAKVTRITLHDLRDTHASLLAKAGVPIEVVSQRLGHSTLTITVDRYITVYRERDMAAADAFDRLVS